MPINHVSLPTGASNYKVMRDFYLNSLQPLGYKVYMEQVDCFLGLQAPRAGPDIWLHCGGGDFPRLDPCLSAQENLEGKSRVHLAIDVGSRKKVDEWYRAALKAGGICNGAPGERSYANGYYAAFVLDPLGNNIEAVHFNPLWLQLLKVAPGVLVGVVGVIFGRFVLG
ncbi:Glyoxalase/Bleomycin resistance protein/Dihydroxybiphenyl dioxygenase [Cladorrhinum sp. PSN332]|nr:Glyoxalase/Bleomycin resistance protein/Dihydroxybiphenyl dioxygenase [Cladorrhinum sp. PSN332]